jgi:hypothetical protein
MLAVLEQREGFDQAFADEEFAAIDPMRWTKLKR